MRKINKKGQVMQNLGALGIGIATLALILTVAFLVVANVQDQVESTAADGNWSTAYNATVTLQGAAETVPGWVPLVVIVAIGGIILSMVALFRR